MALFVLAVNKGLCATFRTILVVMRLVHIQPVHAELVEGDDIVLARGGSELLAWFPAAFSCAPAA